MAKVMGAFFSVSGSGTLGKALTAGNVRGVAYMRKWFKPTDTPSVKKTNVRLAFSIANALGKTLTGEQKTSFVEGASGTKDTYFSLFMGRALKAYKSQLGVEVEPASVTCEGNFPSDVFTWVAAT